MRPAKPESAPVHSGVAPRNADAALEAAFARGDFGCVRRLAKRALRSEDEGERALGRAWVARTSVDPVALVVLAVSSVALGLIAFEYLGG